MISCISNCYSVLTELQNVYAHVGGGGGGGLQARSEFKGEVTLPSYR